MKKVDLLTLALLFIMPTLSIAGDDISSLYKKYGIEGALIITSLDGSVEYIHNVDRVEHQYLPASTFKIPNTLIALEEGAIKDDKEVISWDGNDKGLDSWNRDQTLESAFVRSCVWCYQGFAEKIGNEKYLKYLSALGYGNKKTGDDVTTFWLQGDLVISAREQIAFLMKLYKEELPFTRKNIRILKKIMLDEENSAYSLSAKTGWANRIKNQHGWYVGYIEVNEKIWMFANNIQIKSKADLAFRKRLVIESLKLKGII